MCIVSKVNGSRGKIRCGQVVKAIFQRSKILTPVAALYTAPMGVTSPLFIVVETMRQPPSKISLLID